MLPRRALPAGILASTLLFATACERGSTDLLRPTDRQREVVDLVAELGLDGPVGVTDYVAVDDRGRRPAGSTLLVPVEDGDRLRRGLRERPALGRELRRALAAQEVTDPEAVDPGHNAPAGDLGAVLSPSRLNGADPFRSELRLTTRFLNFDENGDVYVVESGEVLETFIVPRDSAGGHWHGGEEIDLESRKPLRVGTMEPATGTFGSGAWSSTWLAPEFSQEVTFDFEVREIGGPNDGDVNRFFALEANATRQIGLTRLPRNDAHYVRTGGTPAHPEAFNDWGEGDVIVRIQRLAAHYNRVTGDRTSVNDIGLFFGGRFDAGRQEGGTFVRCSDARPDICWGYSHVEHRGSEGDIRPVDRADSDRRRTFHQLVLQHFPSVYVHSSHWHVRGAFSPYGQGG